MTISYLIWELKRFYCISTVYMILINYSKKDVYDLSVKQAGQAMKIRSDRYREGLERTSDLMMAESQLAETKLKSLQSIYEYNVAVFQYEWLSGQAKL